MYSFLCISPKWKRTCVLVAAMSAASLLAVRCGVPQVADDDGSVPEAEPERMLVTRFTVAEGEERRVSANLEIIASEGIEIAGDLFVDPTEPGDIKLVAEDGDIIISGRLVDHHQRRTGSASGCRRR